MRTALIDGDSIAYILGWNLRTETDEGLMCYSVDNFLKTMFQVLEITHYIGALSSKPVFRDQVYCYCKYKGNRKEDDPDIARWKPVVNHRLMTEWQFTTVANLEADDIVGWHAFNESLGERIICSQDKDLKQVKGTIYDYRTGEKYDISLEQAIHNFHMQLVCGDPTDNIKGVPGLGAVKGGKKLLDGVSPYQMYIDYFGNHYGAIIYEETLATVQVMQPGHSYETYFEAALNRIKPVEADYQYKFLDGVTEIT